MIDVSIIIVNYRTAQLVVDCLRSVFEKTQGIQYEVIVVDNDSGDDSLVKLRDTFGDRIKLIASKENLGFGKGNNLGAESASGRYLFLLNPDTVLINNAIQILAEYLDQHPEAGAAGGNLFFPDMRPAPSFCLRFDDLDLERERAAWQYILGRKIKDKLETKNGNSVGQKMSEFNGSGNVLQVAYVFGADMMIRHDLFQKLNGFDRDFFMYGEEEEFSRRIQKAGYSIVSVPGAEIIHLEGAATATKTAFNERQYRMRMQGTMTYYWKSFGLQSVSEFYRLRSLRHKRLIAIASLRGKKLDDFGPSRQQRILNDVFAQFMKDREAEHG